MRRRICAGNWKMHKTGAETAAFFQAFLPLAAQVPDEVEIVVCPPFTGLGAAALALREAQGQRVRLGAQNVHWEISGAFTGEISTAMLAEFGVEYVIVGHSERRQYFGETDEGVRKRAAAALNAGITPIIAVGESLEIRRAGGAQAHVTAQTRAALDGLDDAAIERAVIAYEPVWAIGTGQNCDPVDANAIMGAIRHCSAALANVPILYGGSVKPQNIAQYCGMPEIDGALVGGASLDPHDLSNIATGAAAR